MNRVQRTPPEGLATPRRDCRVGAAQKMHGEDGISSIDDPEECFRFKFNGTFLFFDSSVAGARKLQHAEIS
jgi:hypothetical protein